MVSSTVPDGSLIYQIWAVHTGVLFNVEEATEKEDPNSHDCGWSDEENFPPKPVHDEDCCDITKDLEDPNNESVQTYNCK